MTTRNATPPIAGLALGELPATFGATRDTLQRVGTHILARRRYAVSGKFGLRATPGGFGTPAFGREYETVRIAGTHLVRERTGASARTTTLDLAGATLADAAAATEVDLTEPFEAGHDTPPVGDPSARLEIDTSAAVALGEWFRFGWAVLDATLASLPPDAEPSVIQLWPEHFDAAFDAAAAPERRVNLGAAPGDSFSAQPYLYVGPWDADRPGDASYWNASFGAVLTYDELRASEDPVATGTAFMLRGITLLRS